MKYLHTLLLTLLLSSVILFSSALLASNDLKIVTIVEPPFSRIESDRLVGFNIEVAKALAASIGLNPVFIQCPFARCLTMLEKGKADLMIGIAKLPVREKNLTFIEPVLFVQNKPLRFYSLVNQNISITSLGDLDKYIVGIMRGGAYFPEFDNSMSIKKIELTSQDQLVSMLLKGRIDLFLDREESIRPLLTSQEYKDKIALADYQYNKPVGSYIAISKHSHIANYADELSMQLKNLMNTGVIKQLEVDYLPISVEK
jgi:ABC-type amino acid transport substrate-binding protein